MGRRSSEHAGAALVRSDAAHRKKHKGRSRWRVQTRGMTCKFERRSKSFKASTNIEHRSRPRAVHARPASSALSAVVALVNLCYNAHLLMAGTHAATTFVRTLLLHIVHVMLRAPQAKNLQRQTYCSTHHAQDAAREQGAWAKAASRARASLTQALVAHAPLAHPFSNALAPVCPERSQSVIKQDKRARVLTRIS